jgi:pimeloyl-ACP methyl ester carboxylesterase
MMMRTLLTCLILIGFSAAQADIVVLVHGYHSSGTTWRSSGVLNTMSNQGWTDIGDYFETPTGFRRIGPQASSRQLITTVDLPSEAPVVVQSGLLSGYLKQIGNDFPDQQIILIGHSAGGVVARHSQVTNPNDRVMAIITLASPHLGTASAEVGALVSDSPLGIVAPAVGMDTINRSRTLYEDLMRERWGSMLHWLNRQQHPDIIWISLVRSGAYTGSGKFVVPGYSQDMRNVVMLGNRAISYTVPGGHELNIIDGPLLADIISKKVHGEDTKALK